MINKVQDPAGKNLVGYPKFNGSGLGNLLWIWAKCFVWCKDHHIEMIGPRWAQFRPVRFLKRDADLRFYKGYFINKGYINGLAKYYKLLAYESITVENFDDTLHSIPTHKKNVVVFSGLGKFTPLIGRHKEVHAELLRIADPHCLPAKHVHSFIAIHIRRGDFGKGTIEDLRNGKTNLQIPIEWYVSALRALRKETVSSGKVIVFSDGTDEELSLLLLESNVERSTQKNALKDLLKMSYGAALIASRSSFSLWASYLGQIPTLYYKGARPWHEDIVDSGSCNSLEIEWDDDTSFESTFIKIICTRLALGNEA